MELETRLLELAESIKELPGIRKQVNQLGVLQTRREQFERVRDACDEALREATVLVDAGIISQVPREPSLQIHGRELERLKSHFEDDPTSLESNFNFKEFSQGLDSKLNQFRSQLQDSWLVYMRGQVNEVDSEVLDTLAQIPAFQATIEEIRRLQPAIAEARSRLPSSSDDVDRARQLAEDLAETWATLGGEMIPAEVLVFLREASTQGAPIAGLTEAVLSWLKDNNLLDQFRIQTARVGSQRYV